MENKQTGGSKVEMTDWAQFIREQGDMQQEMLRIGIKVGEERFNTAVRTLDVAYRQALLDPKLCVPSYLTAAIYALIMRLEKSETVEAVVQALRPTKEQFGKLIESAQKSLKD
jgi:hypothetical protein